MRDEKDTETRRRGDAERVAVSPQHPVSVSAFIPILHLTPTPDP